VTKELRIIDLFAGLGGLRIGTTLAAEKQGLQVSCVFTSEIKPSAIETYKRNFPGEAIHGDISKVDADEIPDFDILLAGFPCQPFSSAGKGKGFADTRGTLFFEIERILEAKKPSGFILENVEGLVNHDKGRTLEVILESLARLGYKVSWEIFDSSEFSLAQKRKRIYIVGARSNEVDLTHQVKTYRDLGSVLEKKFDPILWIDSPISKLLLRNFKIDDLLGKQIRDKRGGPDNVHSWDISLKGKVSKRDRELLGELLKQRRRRSWAIAKGIPWSDGMPLTLDEIWSFTGSDLFGGGFKDKEELESALEKLLNQGYLAFEEPKKGKGLPGYNIVTGKLSFDISYILHPRQATPTLVATDVTKLAVPLFEPEGFRRLTLREGLRLFGFPDSYTFPASLSYSKAFDLLGNSVTITVVEHAAARLIKSL